MASALHPPTTLSRRSLHQRPAPSSNRSRVPSCWRLRPPCVARTTPICCLLHSRCVLPFRFKYLDDPWFRQDRQDRQDRDRQVPRQMCTTTVAMTTSSMTLEYDYTREPRVPLHQCVPLPSPRTRVMQASSSTTVAVYHYFLYELEPLRERSFRRYNPETMTRGCCLCVV